MNKRWREREVEEGGYKMPLKGLTNPRLVIVWTNVKYKTKRETHSKKKRHPQMHTKMFQIQFKYFSFISKEEFLVNTKRKGLLSKYKKVKTP